MDNEDNFYLNWGYSIGDQKPLNPLSTNYVQGLSPFYSFPSSNRPPPDYACPDCEGYGEISTEEWHPAHPCETCQGTGVMAIPMGEFWG